jgi:hypothetical protein
VAEREWIAFERVSVGAVWALLAATRSLPWPLTRGTPARRLVLPTELEALP